MLNGGIETGYAIKRTVDRSTRFFWAASLAQVYPELAALEDDDYVVSADEPHGARPRKTYRLTDKGRQALDSWLHSERVPDLQQRDEGLLRPFFADALPPASARGHRRRQAGRRGRLAQLRDSVHASMTVAFLLTSLVVVATPGTGALITIAAGLSRGARASIVAAFGCTLGIVPHLAAAVTGTAALLRASGVAFEVVKFAGVAYLLFMAWATWRDRSALVIEDARPRSARRVVVSAVLANLLNPKLTIFFFAFLPQFVPVDAPHQLPRMLELGAVFMAMTFLVFALYGIFAAGVRRHLIDRPRVVQQLRRLFAGSFVALGAKLAATSR